MALSIATTGNQYVTLLKVMNLCNINCMNKLIDKIKDHDFPGTVLPINYK